MLLRKKTKKKQTPLRWVLDKLVLLLLAYFIVLLALSVWEFSANRYGKRANYAASFGLSRDGESNVSEAAKAQVRLLKQGVERFQKLFNVKSGVNELKAPIPSTLQKGVYRLELAFRDAKGQHKTYRADVTVPV